MQRVMLEVQRPVPGLVWLSRDAVSVPVADQAPTPLLRAGVCPWCARVLP